MATKLLIHYFTLLIYFAVVVDAISQETPTVPLQDISNTQATGSKDARMQRRLTLLRKRKYHSSDMQEADVIGSCISVEQNVQVETGQSSQVVTQANQTAGSSKLLCIFNIHILSYHCNLFSRTA